MTHHEAELEFHNDVKAAMLNAWKNGLSDMMHHENSKPLGTPPQ
jgi:hypothetical protein